MMGSYVGWGVIGIFMKQKCPKSTLLAENTRGLTTNKQSRSLLQHPGGVSLISFFIVIRTYIQWDPGGSIVGGGGTNRSGGKATSRTSLSFPPTIAFFSL